MASGLQMLQGYESEQSEEEEINTAVSQESLKDQTTKHPLPQVLRDMFNTSKTQGCEDLDDPALHDGRVRSFPHRRGNWVSFLAISLNECDSVAHQREIFLQSCTEIPDTEFQLCADFHLSLTKTLVFRHHWIESFLASLKQQVVQIQRFDLIYDQFEVYVNEDKTRTFVGMRVYPSASLHSLISTADKLLADYDLEPYYGDPSFHVSIGWTLGDKADEVKKSLLLKMNALWRDTVDEDISLQHSTVETVQFKTGNKLYEIHLGI